MKNYYELLGVPHHASRQQIRQAYLVKCKQYHPDLHDGANWADEQLKSVNEAYDVLSDAFSRQRYDAALMEKANNNETIFASPEPAASAEPINEVLPIKKRKPFWIYGSVLAVLLWGAVVGLSLYEPKASDEVPNYAIEGELTRFKQFCERHPKLIRKSEFRTVMQAEPPVGFTFELERLLAQGDTTLIRERIEALKNEKLKIEN